MVSKLMCVISFSLVRLELNRFRDRKRLCKMREEAIRAKYWTIVLSPYTNIMDRTTVACKIEMIINGEGGRFFNPFGLWWDVFNVKWLEGQGPAARHLSGADHMYRIYTRLEFLSVSYILWVVLQVKTPDVSKEVTELAPGVLAPSGPTQEEPSVSAKRKKRKPSASEVRTTVVLMPSRV